MTPNPNPSPELRERLQARLTAHLSGDRRNDRNWPLVIDASELAEIVTALTPPTPAETVTVALPGAGEVEQKIGNSGLLDADISARAKAHVAAMEIVTADPIAALEALATVAAANDEGVADMQVLRAAVKNLLPIGNDQLPGDRVIPIYVRMDELRALHVLATSRSKHEGAE